MRKIMLYVIGLTCLLQVPSYAQDINAKAAYVVHPATGTILLNQNGSGRVGPASLTKMMTLYVLFSALEDNTLTLESELPVSEAAWRKGGSKMFIEVGKTVKVEDLIRGIAISSGNDACIAVAEYLGGTEANFATMMNRAAKKLGLTGTNFANASGWPDPNQYTTAKDMAALGTALQQDFPTYYKYFSEKSFTYSDIKQPNRNWLLSRGLGVDGMKTGHTEADGYHLVSSMVRNGERFVAAVLGTESMAERANQSQAALMSVAIGQVQQVVKNGQILVPELAVHHGVKHTTSISTNSGLKLFVTPTLQDKMTADITYTQPLIAPVSAGTQVGMLTLKTPYQKYDIPLITTEDVAKDTWFNRYLRHAGQKLGL